MYRVPFFLLFRLNQSGRIIIRPDWFYFNCLLIACKHFYQLNTEQLPGARFSD